MFVAECICRLGPVHFLVRCHTQQLNKALSVSSVLSQVSFEHFIMFKMTNLIVLRFVLCVLSVGYSGLVVSSYQVIC